ncbi:MAG: efflux RND transporter periplasmic adaptor subunit [Burkholderiales bacterium]|nr:efflux RND transporter periplasmic adaptor subunit [Burkholderiales bacterium]
MRSGSRDRVITSRLTPFAVLLSAIVLSGCNSGDATLAPQMPPPPAVSVAAVVSKEVTQWDEFNGHVEAVDTVQIRPRVAGYIDEIHFQEGAEVKKGDVLFVIDQRSYRAELNRAQAELERSRAQSVLASAQAERAKKLLQTRVMSRDEYDERIAAHTQARAAIRASEAAVEVAKLNLEYTTVRSPIDGRTGRALVTPGNLVSGGEMVPEATLLTTVVSLDPVYVYFEGDEATHLRYSKLARDGERPSSRVSPNPVFVGLGDEEGFPHKGLMNFINNQLDPGTGTIRVRAVLDNKERIFMPGMFARIKVLASGAFQAVLIDDKAVLTDQDRKYVYVLGEGNTAQRRDIKPGRMVDGLRIVERGLSAGDKVIVHGVQKVFFPGMPVAPQVITMGDPPAAPTPPGPPAAAAGGEGEQAPAPKEAPTKEVPTNEAPKNEAPKKSVRGEPVEPRVAGNQYDLDRSFDELRANGAELRTNAALVRSFANAGKEPSA